MHCSCLLVSSVCHILDLAHIPLKLLLLEIETQIRGRKEKVWLTVGWFVFAGELSHRGCSKFLSSSNIFSFSMFHHQLLSLQCKYDWYKFFHALKYFHWYSFIVHCIFMKISHTYVIYSQNTTVTTEGM